MAYLSKKMIGGGFTVKAGELAGNPLVDSYTFEREDGGVTYRWTGIRPQYLTPNGDLQFHLPDQEMHSEGGPYTVDCGMPLAWKNP